MRGPRAVPGTIRYTEIIGKNGKKTLKKEKYYYWQLSFGNLTYAKYNEYRTGYAGNPDSYQDHTDWYPSLNELIYQILPDRDVDFSKVNSHLFKKPIGINWSIQPNDITTLEDYIVEDDPFIQENDFEEYISTLQIGTYFIWSIESQPIKGYGIYDCWAQYKHKDEKQPDTQAPGALDFDYKPEDVIAKQDDIQLWSNQYLLPPIFGLTNCVYFPSNLDGYKEDTDKPELNQWGIISQYPIAGLKIITDSIYQITGKKDQVYTIETTFNFFTKTNKFPRKIDDITQEDIDNSYNPNKPTEPEKDKPKTEYIPDSFYKKDVCFNAKIYYKEGEKSYDSGYAINCIIIEVNIPKTYDVKGSITFKSLTELNLSKDDYFIGGFEIIPTYNNFVQNETYNIKPYYRKDLGLGPRLGGSIMGAVTNDTSGEIKNYPIGQKFYYVSILKDNPKVNIPYKDGISFSGDFCKYNLSTEEYNITHTFQKNDEPGVFKNLNYPGVDQDYFPGVNNLLYSKYYFGYQTYLIKNLDEHDYEYYDNLKKSAQLNSLNIFMETYDNPNLSFDSN